jgi:hypothetical protein
MLPDADCILYLSPMNVDRAQVERSKKSEVLAQILGQLPASHREIQPKCWANFADAALSALVHQKSRGV